MESPAASTAEFKLVIEGISDDSAQAIQRIKGILIADLDLSVAQVQEILQGGTRELRRAAREEELFRFYKALKGAGAKVLIVRPAAEPQDEASPSDSATISGMTVSLDPDNEAGSALPVAGSDELWEEIEVLEQNRVEVDAGDLEMLLDINLDFGPSSDEPSTDSSSAMYATSAESIAPLKPQVDSGALETPVVPASKSDGHKVYILNLDEDAPVIGMMSTEEPVFAALLTETPAAAEPTADMDAPVVDTPATEWDLDDLRLSLEESQTPSMQIEATEIEADVRPIAAEPTPDTSLMSIDPAPAEPLPTVPEPAAVADGLELTLDERDDTPPPPKVSDESAPSAMLNLELLGIEIESPEPPPATNIRQDPPKPSHTLDAGDLTIAPEPPQLADARHKEEPRPVMTHSAGSGAADPVTINAASASPQPSLQGGAAQLTRISEAGPPAEVEAVLATKTPTKESARKKQLQPQAIAAIMIGALVLGAGNWFYFQVVARKEVPEIAIAMPEQTAGDAAPQKPAPAAAPEVSDTYAGELEIDGLQMVATVAFAGTAPYTAQVQLLGPEPPQLTPEQIVRQEIRAPWLKKVELTVTEFSDVDDGKFMASVPTRLYVEYNGRRGRITGSATVTVIDDRQKDKLFLDLHIAHNTTAEDDKSPTWLIAPGPAPGTYRVKFASVMELQRVPRAATTSAKLTGEQSETGASVPVAENSAPEPAPAGGGTH